MRMTRQSHWQHRKLRMGLCHACGRRKRSEGKVRCKLCLRKQCEAYALKRAERDGKSISEAKNGGKS